MSSVALSAPVVSRPAINPWIVALAVIVPTFMEVLDTTIANVALRYIAGGLSAAVTDAEWVITSYLAANAVILPGKIILRGPGITRVVPIDHRTGSEKVPQVRQVEAAPAVRHGRGGCV